MRRQPVHTVPAHLGALALACAGALVPAQAGAAGEAPAPAASAAAYREVDARVLYALNCLGCHPAPAGGTDNSRYSRVVEGEFAQTPAGRVFFMRMPPSGQPLAPATRAQLRDELDRWKRACPVLLRASTWNLSNLQ